MAARVVINGERTRLLACTKDVTLDAGYIKLAFLPPYVTDSLESHQQSRKHMFTLGKLYKS